MRNRFYRVRAKALILDETRIQFLIVEDSTGRWEIPGGGLDWGESVDACIAREIEEEMGLEVSWTAPQPSYFVTWEKKETVPFWVANVFYEVEVAHLNFTPSEECVAYVFVSSETLGTREVFPGVQLFADVFDPKKHSRPNQ